MKTKLLVGAVMAVVWGGSALAAEPMNMSDKKEHKRADILDNLSVMAGGGFEGFSGVLNDSFKVGPAWGATVGVQPLSWMGAEIGYSGAVHEIQNEAQDVNGADMVRNGAQVALTFNIPTPIVQPYALTGIGFDRYNIRAANSAALKDDTAGRIPLGGGVRARVGPLMADARLAYEVLFDQEFARADKTTPGGGAYTGLLSIGGRF